MALPYSTTSRIFNAAALTATVAIPSSDSAAAIQLSVTTAGFTGTIDIQGKLDASDTYVNLQYVTVAAGSLTPAVAQLSYTTQTATTSYIVLTPMPFMQAVMTRSAGSVTMYARGYSEPFTLPVTTTGGVAATDLGKAEDQAHVSGDTGIMALGVVNSDSGTTFSSTNGDYVPLSTNTTGNLEIVGPRAHDAVALGGPLLLGAYATNAVPADVSAVADVTRLAAGLDGVLFVRQRPRTPWSKTHAAAASAQATIAQASAGAGLKNVMRGFSFIIGASGAVASTETITINIRDGATGAGTVLWSYRVQVPVMAAAGQIFSFGLTDVYLEGSAATAMTIESAAAPTDADIYITVNSWGEVSA